LGEMIGIGFAGSGDNQVIRQCDIFQKREFGRLSGQNFANGFGAFPEMRPRVQFCRKMEEDDRAFGIFLKKPMEEGTIGAVELVDREEAEAVELLVEFRRVLEVAVVTGEGPAGFFVDKFLIRQFGEGIHAQEPGAAAMGEPRQILLFLNHGQDKFSVKMRSTAAASGGGRHFASP